MKYISQFVSWSAWIVTLSAPVLFFQKSISLEETKTVLLLAAVAWFAATPFWMEHKTHD